MDNRLITVSTSVFVFCICVVISGVDASESDIVLPNNADTSWVSNRINQNGMLLSIRTFESPEPVDSVLEFYRANWFKEGAVPGYIEDEMMEWRLISQLRKDENVVLQLKTNDIGGSSGFLSVAKTDGSGQPVNLDFPLPDATEEFSTTYLKENGSDVHTMTFITKQSIGNTSAFYKDRLKRQGWSVASDSAISGSHVLLFNRRDDRVEMVIQQLNHEDTVVFVNRVQSNA